MVLPLFTFGASGKKIERRPNEVLYKIKDDASPEAKQKLDKILKKYKFTERKRELGKGVKHGKAEIQTNKTEEEIAQEIQDSGAVEFAEPDYIIEPSLEPNDTYYKYQWHLQHINAPSAWDTVTGNSQVKVMICDTGINSSHPDLAGLLLPGKNFVDGSSDTEPTMDHGTKVAGTMAGIGNNGKGISGVVWNIRIIPGKISNQTNGAASFSDMAECITYAGDNGVRVVNLSYKGYGSSTVDSAASYLKKRGGLLFIAAGNDGLDVSSSPNSSNSIVVGSTTSGKVRSSFSNYGKPIDLVAPGSSIFATSLTGYGSWSGTSAASPVAAGTAALLFSYNPNFSPEQVENALFETATDLGVAGEDDVYGYGMVNVGDALVNLQGGQINYPPRALISVNKTSGTAPVTLYFDGSGSTDTDGTIVSYEWTFPGSVKSFEQSPSFTFSSTGVQTVTLKVTDNSGAIDEDQILITIDAPVVNLPPSAVIIADKTVGNSPLTVNFNGSSSTDSDGSIVSYEWTFAGIGKSYQSAASYTFSEPGIYSAVLKVTDNDGATNQASILITVNIAQTNLPPQAIITSSNTSGIAPLVVTFDGSNSYDSDGSISHYEWTFPGGEKSYQPLTSYTFNTSGIHTVILKVTDNIGATNETSININVSSEVVNAPPQASITVNSTTGNVNDTLYFDGSNSTDSDGIIVSYEWTFPGNVKSYSAISSFNFSVAGTQKVYLIVTDDKGASNQTEIIITINGNSGPSIHVNTISLSYTFNKRYGYRVLATVEVLDNNNNPIRYATVSGSYSGAMEKELKAITNSQGLAKLYSDYSMTSGLVNFTLSDLLKTGYSYESQLNMETSGSILLP